MYSDKNMQIEIINKIARFCKKQRGKRGKQQATSNKTTNRMCATNKAFMSENGMSTYLPTI